MWRGAAWVALVAALLVPATFAQANDGWFVTSKDGEFGFADQGRSYGELSDPRALGSPIRASLNTDAVWEKSVGYNFGNFKLEGLAFYREEKFDDVKIEGDYAGAFAGGSHSYKANGTVSALGVMANTWYEYEVSPGFRPYIGGGAGAAKMSVDNSEADYPTPDFLMTESEDWVIAYQVGAGFRYDFDNGSALHVGYRYFSTARRNFSGVGGVAFDTGYSSHTFLIELTIPLR